MRLFLLLFPISLFAGSWALVDSSNTVVNIFVAEPEVIAARTDCQDGAPTRCIEVKTAASPGWEYDPDANDFIRPVSTMTYNILTGEWTPR